jgi:hypothetical protein
MEEWSVGTWERARGAAVVATVGAVALAITAAIGGLDTPLGWGGYGFAIGALSGYVTVPWLLEGRPRSALALAVVLHVSGVLLFPLLGLPLGLESPLGGRARLDQWLGSILPSYGLTPLGFLSALPFLPATLATTMIAGEIVVHRFGGERVLGAARSSPIRARPAVDVDAAWQAIAARRRADGVGSEAGDRAEARRLADADRQAWQDRTIGNDPANDADRLFGRWITVGVGIAIALTIGGLAMLYWIGSSIGY